MAPQMVWRLSLQSTGEAGLPRGGCAVKGGAAAAGGAVYEAGLGALG